MTKKHRLSIALFLVISVVTAAFAMWHSKQEPPASLSPAPAFSENYYDEWISSGFIPSYMQDNTILIVDGEGRCTIAQGGPLTAADVEGRADINLLNLDLSTARERWCLEPNTKIEYDLHGHLNNIYYEVPDAPGTYRLSPPSAVDTTPVCTEEAG